MIRAVVAAYYMVPMKRSTKFQGGLYSKHSRFRAVVFAQLVEWSFLTPEVYGSNQVMSKILYYWIRSAYHCFRSDCPCRNLFMAIT